MTPQILNSLKRQLITMCALATLHFPLFGQCPDDLNILPEIIPICGSNPAILDASDPFWESRSWSTGDTMSMLPVMSPGVYMISATDTNGCVTVDTVQVDSFALPPFSIRWPGPKPSICPDQDLILDAFHPYIDSYLWNDATTDSDVLVGFSGLWKVEVVDSNGCRLSDSVWVEAFPAPEPEIVPSGDSLWLCGAGDTLRLDVFDPAYDSYLWQDLSTDSDYLVSGEGQYQVQVMDSNGCKGDTSLWIGHQWPQFELPEDTGICPGETIVLDGGWWHATFLWEDGATDRHHFVSEPGIYFLQAETPEGCSFWSDPVTVFQYPGPAVPLIQVSTDLLTTDGEDQLQWFLNGLPLPGENSSDIEPVQTGTYAVASTNASGCSALSPPVEFTGGIHIHNGFSPNGDGLNDLFVIANIELYPKNKLKILNRWGNVIYQKAGYANDWNGVSGNGKPLPEGTYFYVLELNDGSEPISDYVILNR